MSEELKQPNDPVETSKEEGQDLVVALEAEVTKAGIRMAADPLGEEAFLEFDRGDDLLAFVAIITSGDPGELYWDAMSYHPDYDRESSWTYMLRPSEGDFELVETNRGKRWCRVLKLEFEVLLPKGQVPEIIKLFRSHNANAEEHEEIASSPSA